YRVRVEGGRYGRAGGDRERLVACRAANRAAGAGGRAVGVPAVGQSRGGDGMGGVAADAISVAGGGGRVGGTGAARVGGVGTTDDPDSVRARRVRRRGGLTHLRCPDRLRGGAPGVRGDRGHHPRADRAARHENAAADELAAARGAGGGDRAAPGPARRGGDPDRVRRHGVDRNGGTGDGAADEAAATRATARAGGWGLGSDDGVAPILQPPTPSP
ncbi:MAG: hypothetical protein QOF73_3066, partial [Thermomicrobiales bacterium]|nr:hypothetical protein [Thermomicrobiales bacterium]